MAQALADFVLLSLLEQLLQCMSRLWLTFFQAMPAEMFTQEAHRFELLLHHYSERWLLHDSCIASKKFSGVTLTAIDV